MENVKNYILPNSYKFPSYADIKISAEAQEFLSDIVESINSKLMELEAAVLDCEQGINCNENMAVIKRIVHTIKGEAGIIGITDIYTLCHQVECLIEELPLEKTLDMLLTVKDWLSGAAQYMIGTDDVVRKPNRKRVLIVEDDFTTRKLLQKYLTEYGDCDIAVDGLEAVAAFKQAVENKMPYSLVCLDIIMPRMNGHETLKAIRRIENENGIYGLDGVKIIMTTVLNDSKNIIGAFREGCEAYIVKPLERHKLLQEVAKLNLV